LAQGARLKNIGPIAHRLHPILLGARLSAAVAAMVLVKAVLILGATCVSAAPAPKVQIQSYAFAL